MPVSVSATMWRRGALCFLDCSYQVKGPRARWAPDRRPAPPRLPHTQPLSIPHLAVIRIRTPAIADAPELDAQTLPPVATQTYTYDDRLTIPVAHFADQRQTARQLLQILDGHDELHTAANQTHLPTA